MYVSIYLCAYVRTCARTYIHTYIHAYIHTYTHTHTYIHACIHTCTHAYIHVLSLGLTNEVMAVATMGRGIQAIVARCGCKRVQDAQGHATVSTPTDHLIPTPRPACLATKKSILKLSHDCYYTQTYIQSTRSQSTRQQGHKAQGHSGRRVATRTSRRDVRVNSPTW